MTMLLAGPPPKSARGLGSVTDQLEFALPEQTPFELLWSEVIDRTEGMYELLPTITLSEYHRRWWAVVDVYENVCFAAKLERNRLREIVRKKGSNWKVEKVRAEEIDRETHKAFHQMEDLFVQAMQPLLDAYETRFPDDEWFGLVLAEDRACEAYGSLTLQQIMDLGETETESLNNPLVP